MIKIRLLRLGKNGLPFYRIVAIDGKKKSKGRALDILGTWYPSKKDLIIKNGKIDKWTRVGAEVSSGVIKILNKK